MAVTVNVADRARVTKRVVGLLGIGPDDGSFSEDTADEGVFPNEAVQAGVLEGDANVCLLIISIDGQPYRNKFMTVTPDELASGAQIPPHLGARSVVECKYQDGTWKPGVLASNLDQILRWNAAPSVYGGVTEIEGGYFVIGDRLYVSGDSANKGRIWTPEFIVTRTGSGVLQAPEVYERTVILESVIGLIADGIGLDSQALEFYSLQLQRHHSLIMSGGAIVPPIEVYKKAGG